MNIVTKAGRLIRYDNPKNPSPPGILAPKNGKAIIVASLMRGKTSARIKNIV